MPERMDLNSVTVLEHVDDGNDPSHDGYLFQALGDLAHGATDSLAQLDKAVIGVLDTCRGELLQSLGDILHVGA